MLMEIAALVAVAEKLLSRGVEVMPRGEGWVIQLAPDTALLKTSSPDDDHETIRRSW